MLKCFDSFLTSFHSVMTAKKDFLFHQDRIKQLYFYVEV